MQFSALKYNKKPNSLLSIQAYNNEFKFLANWLRMAKDRRLAGNLKQDLLQNIQATDGSLIMTIKTLCVVDDTIHYKQTVDKLLKTGLHDNFDQDELQRGLSRRLPNHSKGYTKSDGDIPSIPVHLLDLSRKVTVQQAAGLFLK